LQRHGWVLQMAQALGEPAPFVKKMKVFIRWANEPVNADASLR